MSPASGQTRPDYGLDAPGLIKAFFAITSGALVALVFVVAFAPDGSLWRTLLAIMLGVVALYALGMGCYMIYGSKIAKVRECDRMLDAIAWRGDEQVLDVGCGRGLMLVRAAKRLNTGKATGVDIWQSADQAGNTPEAALENARREAVGDRVTVATADIRKLPFPDATFDVVVSNWVVHNLPTEVDRRISLSEMVRVLRFGGTLILSDIEHREPYRRQLAELGLTDQRLMVSVVKDRILAIVTFGSFRPSAIIAKRSSSFVTSLEALPLAGLDLTREPDGGREEGTAL